MSEPFEFRWVVFPCMLMLCIWRTMTGVACASQSTQEFGSVSMQGSIINTPCAIATKDLDQTIDMAATTLGDVIEHGQGAAHPFSVTLVNCDLSAIHSSATYFMTTFDGPAADGLFSVSGAMGVGLQIADEAGNVATPGKPLAEDLVVSHTQSLNYTLRLVNNHTPLKTGEYSAVLRFKVDYF